MLKLFLLPLAVVALLCVPFIIMAKRIRSGRSPKGAFIGNLCTFAGVMGLGIIIPFGGFVSAAADEGSIMAALSTGAGLGSLAAALAGLPEQTQEEIFLYYFQRLTQKEIGEQSGWTRSTIGRHIQLALKRLKEEMEVLSHE